MPTDVLSFPLLPPDAFPDHPGATGHRAAAAVRFALPPGRRTHLGDIVISVERAIAQAEAGRGGQTGDVRWSPADELRLLAIHGTLHVCGWDHAEPTEEAAMRALEALVAGRCRGPVAESVAAQSSSIDGRAIQATRARPATSGMARRPDSVDVDAPPR